MTPFEITSLIILILGIAGSSGFAGIQIGRWMERER
jgi:hypothetical protein